MISEIQELSPITKLTLLIIAISAFALFAAFTRALLRSTISIISLLYNSIISKKKRREPKREVSGPSSSRAVHTVSHPPAVGPGSIKSLLKKTAQSREQQDTSASDLFITGLKGHTDDVVGLAWSADSSRLVTATADQTVCVFAMSNLSNTKNIPMKRYELRMSISGIAVGNMPNAVALLSQGLAGAAGLACYDLKTRQLKYALENTHQKALGLCLKSSLTSPVGVSLLISSSVKTDIKVYVGSTGELLGAVDSGGLVNNMATISRDGRFVAAATFTSDVKIFEVLYEKRSNGFTGVRKVMDLKGHKSKILAVDFSPDSQRAVTASADGSLKIWDLNVRYAMQEDPKVLLTFFPALDAHQMYNALAWGPTGIIAASYKGSVLHMIDSRTGVVIESVSNPHGGKEIRHLEWAPTTGMLATSGGSAVRLWKAPTTK